MRFHVPQFIGIEDKIFGPLSLKQFIYLAGGAGIVVVIWYFIQNTILTLIISAPIIILSLALAFYKLNGKPFIHTVEAFFKYIGKRRMYIWKKQPKQYDPEDTPTTRKEGSAFAIPRLTKSKLKDLEWVVDVSDNHEHDNKRNA